MELNLGWPWPPPGKRKSCWCSGSWSMIFVASIPTLQFSHKPFPWHVRGFLTLDHLFCTEAQHRTAFASPSFPTREWQRLWVFSNINLVYTCSLISRLLLNLQRNVVIVTLNCLCFGYWKFFFGLYSKT